MAHEIDSIAFRGSRNDIWHRLGAAMPAGGTIDEWSQAAGLGWHAEKSQALARRPSGELVPVEGQFHLTRSDNGFPLGYVSDQYQPVQPADVLEWFRRYVSVDDRFEIDVAGSLKRGKVIWATATYRGGSDVAGEKHVARLLMTTSFDGSSATVNQATMTRVVCNNTLRAALTGDKRAMIRTTHATRFNAAKVGKELAGIAESVETYKAMGEAMSRAEMPSTDTSAFFKSLLDIPFDAKWSDLSARKRNIFDDLRKSYSRTVQEGTPRDTPWCALNAVTRYVDHDRSTRGDVSDGFYSAQFGSGDDMKRQAADLLAKYTETARSAAGVPVPASFLEDAVSRLAAEAVA